MTETISQIAALPIRLTKASSIEVLMVTSRDTGRWVPPKGWLMDNKKPWAAAKIEALEEAGAEGEIGELPLGTYHYDKLLGDGSAIRCEVTLYPMIVTRLRRRWKERRERKRRWFTVKSAAREVAEPDLRKLLESLRKDPLGQRPIKRAVRKL